MIPAPCSDALRALDGDSLLEPGGEPGESGTRRDEGDTAVCSAVMVDGRCALEITQVELNNC